MDKKPRSDVCYNFIPFVIFVLVFPLRLYQATKTNYREGQIVVVKSCVTEQPVQRGANQIFKIEGIYVKTSSIFRINYGDCLKLTGTLKKKVTTGFYSDFYLLDQTIAKIDRLDVPGRKNTVFHDLFLVLYSRIIALRTNIQNIYYQIFSAPQSQLLAGMVLGTNENYSYDFYQTLINSGTLHIVAASGTNLVIFVGSAFYLASILFGRKRAIVLSFFLIWFYILLSGIQASILRAGLMLFVIYIGQYFGRQASVWRTLGLVGGVMLVLKPLYWYDVGFWLSFSAVAGLFWLGKPLQSVFRQSLLRLFQKNLTELFNITQSLTETTAAYLGTLPVSLVVFHQTNLLTIIPNLLILWLVPYLMGLGGILAVIGLVSMPAAIAVGQILWPALTYITWVIDIFGQKINTNWQVPNLMYFVPFIIFLYYFVIYKTIVKRSK